MRILAALPVGACVHASSVWAQEIKNPIPPPPAGIDIMEKPWLDDRVTHNLHCDGYGEHHKHEGARVTVPGLMEGWHTFGLLWLPDEYVFCVDGKETWRTDACGICQAPQYMLLGDEIGKWAGDITKAKLPDQFMVDFVRVYDLVEKK
jgi:beta-glucanase (GH16 family)